MSPPNAPFKPRIIAFTRSLFDRATLGTVFASLVGQVSLVASGVIAARLLGPTDRGHLAAFAIVAVVSSYLLALGMPTAVAYEGARNPGSMRACLRAVRTTIALQLLACMVLPPIVLYALYAHSETAVLTAAMVASPAGLLFLVNMYGLSILQGCSRFARFNTARVLPAVAYAISVLAVLISGSRSLVGFSLAFLVAYLVSTVLLVALVREEFKDSSEHSIDARGMLKFGLKAQIGVASPMESFQLDQVAVGSMVGPSGLGIYVVATSFSNLPRWVAQSFGMVAFPRVASRAGTGEARNIAKLAIFSTALVTGAIVIALEALMPGLVAFFYGSEFAEAVPVARVVLIGAFCLGMRRVLGDVLRGVGSPLPSTAAEIATWITFGALIVPLTSWHGSMGAATAMATSAFVGLFALFVMAAKRSRKAQARLKLDRG